ncbi:uncharacterized protein LOC117118785 [Anneissia japonica]|uniref:uncharacterized protein LOC117118785 n=1 Tax=Anneissia japonica TaxID=1529436 RepID=UPI0014255066|nr:uncharacterized protein LOC117118785 [Anneissia japonica]
MILPVWIRVKGSSTEKLVYCILDSQSNTCFMSQYLVDQFSVKGTPTQLKLSTMFSANTLINCEKITDLEVVSFDRKTVISLQTVYTRNSIPAERTQIPTPDVAIKWDHLLRKSVSTFRKTRAEFRSDFAQACNNKSIADQVVPYMPNVPVPLLIGNNVPSIIRPRDIIAGEEDQPYAQKSILGWGIVGTICKTQTV